MLSKYPRAYPWSPAAAERAHEPYRPAGRGLIIEHLRPRRLLVVELMDRAEALTAAEQVDLVSNHLTAAVITAEEDRKLRPHG